MRPSLASPRRAEPGTRYFSKKVEVMAVQWKAGRELTANAITAG